MNIRIYEYMYYEWMHVYFYVCRIMANYSNSNAYLLRDKSTKNNIWKVIHCKIRSFHDAGLLIKDITMPS